MSMQSKHEIAALKATVDTLVGRLEEVEKGLAAAEAERQAIRANASALGGEVVSLKARITELEAKAETESKLEESVGALVDQAMKEALAELTAPDKAPEAPS